MSMRRLTITLPQYLHDNLTRRVGDGEVSRFVRTAVEKELSSVVASSVDEFLKLRRKLIKHRLSRRQILSSIHKGRA